MLTGLPAVTHAQPVSYSTAAHDALVRGQASKDSPQVLSVLHGWLDDPQGPKGAERLRVLADYVTLSSREGRHAEALDAANNTAFSQLPDYALDALFYSARSIRDTGYETSVVVLTEQRQPGAPLTRLRRAYLSFDTGQSAIAQQLADGVVEDSAAPAGIRSSAAELVGGIADANGDWVGAVRAYDRALELNPASRSARRAGAYVLADQRAAPEALRDALAANARAADAGEPALFGAVEIASLRQQAIGQQVSWAILQRDVVGGARRHEAINEVLRESDAWLAEYGDSQDKAIRAVRDRLLVDRIDALNARGYYRESTDLYEALVRDGVHVPYYGLTPAADSYAQQRRSDIAVQVYEQALAEAGDALPMPSDAHIGLVYAYMDTGRFDDADKLLTQLEAHTPPTLRLAPAAGTPNPQYTGVRELRARYLLYTDRPKHAETMFSELHRRAPFNESLGEGWSRTASLRDRPYAAFDEAKLVVADHPESVAGRVAHAEGLLGTGRIRKATEEIDRLELEYPETGAVRRAVLDRDIVHAPSLRVDSTFGKGSGNNTLSNRDWQVDARLQSGLIDNTWRIFAHQVSGYGDTANGTARRNRTGLGLSRERGAWLLEGEVHNSDGSRKQGVAAAASYRPTDHLVFGLSFDSNTTDLPWKAYNARIAANRAEVSAGYIVNESRRFDASYQRMQFSDSNVSQGVQGSWTERWYSGPRAQFQTTLGVGTTANRLTDTAYFSPRNGTSVDLTARYQWLTWKRDDRTFVQRIYGSVGSYQQAGFGAQSMYGARYEHEWSFRRAIVVTYGLGVLYHPYDGQRERRTLGYLNLAIPFF